MTLRWAPPVQSTPTVFMAGTGYKAPVWGPDEDVVVVFPSSARVGSFDSTGGRHVRIIGGKVAKSTAGTAIRCKGVSGSVFLEGLDIDCSRGSYDAINASAPDVYIQNCRITGVNGSLRGVHADIFQVQGPIERVHIDQVSGRSGYQGFTFGREYPIGDVQMSRVDLGYELTPNDVTYLLILHGADEAPVPTCLRDVYIQPKPGQILADDAVWPFTGMPGAAVMSSDGRYASWPQAERVCGKITNGVPAAGDFVPVGSVGIGYISPGYR